MHSLVMMNGQLQQVGPPLQTSLAASHLSQDATQNQQVWSGNNSHYYRTFNPGVQPLHTSNVALHNKAYSNGQMVNGQNSADFHQAVYSQNNYGQYPKDYLLRMLLSNASLPSTNLRSGNSSFPAACESQATIHYTSTQNQRPHNANTSFTQHDLSLFWKPSPRVNERHLVQDSKIVTYSQQSSHQGPCQNVNVGLKRAPPPYSTAVASFSREPFNNPSMSVSTGTHSRQTVQAAQNQIPTQNSAECRFSQSYHQQRTTPLSSPQDRRDATKFTNTNSRNQYEKGYLAPGTNIHALNPSVAPQQMQMQRHRLGVDSVVNSSISGSDSRLTSSSGHHSVTVSNPNMLPVTSLSGNYNSSTSQPSPLHSLKSMAESNMLRGQHSVNLPPQQNLMPVNNVAQKRNSVGSRLSNPSQPMQGPDRLSSQRNNIQSLVTILLESPEKRELPSPIKQNDSSINSTPGHTNTRAVAVVQPLSQKGSNTANCDSPVSTEKELISSDGAKNTETAYLREDAQIDSENTEQIRPSKVVSYDGAVLNMSNSEPQNSTQKSEMSTTIAKDAPKSLEMPAGCPNKQTPMVTSPSAHALELSTLPVSTWTFKALTDLILESEKAQEEPKEQLKNQAFFKILGTFWKKDPYAWFQSYKEGLHNVLLSEVWDFCAKYVKEDTVILSQVKQSFEEKVNHYHVLKDEAYSEEPYKSSWLNVNDELDDIDKEFGFPWVLKHHLYLQTDEVKLASHSLEPVAKETQNKIFSQREPESIHLTVEQGTTSTPSASPATSNELKKDNATDSCYSFKIQVLSPEAAKFVYEEVQKNLHQTSDSQGNKPQIPQILQIPQDLDVLDPKMKTGPVDPINEVCCLARLMEMNSGLSTPSYKCLCNGEQSSDEWTDKTSSSDSESPVRSKEDTKCQIITFSAPKLCKEIHDIIDLTGSDDVLCSSPCQETKIISQTSNDSQPNIENLGENEDEDRVSVFRKEIDFEGECAQVLTDTPSSTPVTMARQTKLEDFYCTKTKVDPQMLERKEDHRQAQLECANVGELPKATEGQAKIGGEPAHTICGIDTIHEKESQSQSSLSNFFSTIKESKKSNVSVDLSSRHIPEALPSASEAKTAELMLFGSAQRRKRDFSGNRKGYSSCPSYAKCRPPEVLSVNLDPLRKSSTQTADSGKYSLKQRLYEKWRKSMPNTSGHRKKLKRSISAPSIGRSPKRAKQPISSETSDCNGIHQQSLKRRLSMPNKLRLGKVKKRSYSVTLEHPAKKNSNRMAGDSDASRPFQDNIVLKFSVLPNTFNFKDGRKEYAESVSGNY